MKFLTFMAALIFAGCSDASNTCTRHTDCFSGEYCVGGACGPDAPSTNNSTNSNTNNSTNNPTNNNSTSSSNNSTNNSTINTNNSTTNPTNNSTTNTNNSTNNSTNNNSTNNGTNDGSYAYLKRAYPDSACVVDVFNATCTTPDDNESFSTYLNSGNGAGGCLRDDDANPIDFTNSLEMCATELKDKYQTNVVPCDTTDFILEVFVTPKLKCDPELYTVDLVLLGNGRRCSDGDPTFVCKFEADGTWHASVIVKPQNSVLTADVRIESAYPNVIDFEYDLRFLTRN